MLSRLFSRRAVPPATASSNVPDGSRVYAIGDIHGCVGLLKKLHALILEDAASHTGDRKVVIYLGDYIDRGPDSRAVVDLLIDEPLSGFESIHLKGNHEEILLRFLEDARVGLGGGRMRAADTINVSVGFSGLAGLGQSMQKGEALGFVHARTQQDAEAAIKAVQAAYQFGTASARHNPVLERISG